MPLLAALSLGLLALPGPPDPSPSPRVEVRWSFPTRGPIRGAPAVADGVVYAGSGDGNLYAVDAATGRARWAFETDGAVASSPLVADGAVYFTSRDGRLYALDAATGRERWRYQTGDNLPYGWGFDLYLSSPRVAVGTVYVGSGDGHVYAVEAATGRERWRFDAGARVRSSPAVAGETVFVGDMDGRFYALDVASGRERWRFEVDGRATDPETYGFDRWAVVSSPTVAAGRVVFGSRDGTLYALDAETGEVAWRNSHGTSWVMTSPAVHDGTVYAGSSDAAFVQAVDLASGEERWRFGTNGIVWSSPAVEGDAVYAGSGGGLLYALDRTTGGLLWSLRTEGAIFSSPTVRDGVAYVGSDDGRLYAVAVPDAPRPEPLRVVFWEETDRPIWFRNGAEDLVRRFFEREGYGVLDGRRLAAFVRERLADRRPSVVVFASNWVPGDLLDADTSEAALFRQYLDVGRAVWLAPPPLANVRDSSGAQVGVDYGILTRVLGLRYAGPDTRGFGGFYRAEVTPEGVRRGLRGWWVSPAAVDAGEVTTVLARNEYGRAAAWEKTFGGPPGTGLLQLWVDRDAPRDLGAIRTAAEHGLW